MSHEKNQALISVLTECAVVCNHCYSACLEEPDVSSVVGCIKLDRDCADICTITSSLLARGSEHGVHLLKECAEICDACASECEKHAHHHEHCKACAEACRKCAESCRTMQ
ncbi:MAG: four-helix bundle copper-binding protein [Chitinophagaceae bacterium]